MSKHWWYPQQSAIWWCLSACTENIYCRYIFFQLARRTAAMTGLEVARPPDLLGKQGGEVIVEGIVILILTRCPCKISAPWLVAHSHFLLMITSLSVPVDRGGSLADGTLRAWRPLSSPFWRLRHLGEPRTLSLSSSTAMSISSVTSVSWISFAFWLIYILRCHHLCQRYVLRVFICTFLF